MLLLLYYSTWIDLEGNHYNSYSMITTEANQLMSEIHNTKKRIPIILKKEDEQNWLIGEDYNNYKYPYEHNLTAKNLDINNNQLSMFQ